MATLAQSQVLFVTQHYRPELIGSGPFCADMAEWLANHGHSVTVLSGRPHYPNRNLFPDYRNGKPHRETIDGVNVERLRTWAPRSRSALARMLGEALFLLRGAAALATGRVAKHRLVLSLCPSVLSVALGTLARSRAGRHVGIVHDIQSGLAQGLGMVNGGRLVRLMRWCERAVLNRLDLIVVLSPAMRDQLIRIGVTTPIEVVPIWVDTERIRPRDGAGNGGLRLLYSGNLGRKQGLGQIVALAEALQKHRPEIEILVRGGGSHAHALAADILQRGLTNMRLADLLPRERLCDGLCEGDIHLVPQDPEAADFAVPSKVFSIMAAGRPFVATAKPGSTLWLLQEESGGFLCVPPNDPQAFAKAVLRLADDPELRRTLGECGRLYVERNCAKPYVLGRFMTLVDGLSVAR
jgi:colanic acid biosynthesis glycosyl transferase WcaI